MKVSRRSWPQSEVLVRAGYNAGNVSISDIEPTILAAAEALKKEDVLLEPEPGYPCAGRQYRRFILNPKRITVQEIKETY